ncbi:Sorbitol dehydrogenase [Eumeta japonica]|uniref:Sorbitol dehydrogenase n=1 Tax=Eumeta variegata TaxID=151549 RepID=A0A4C1X750_EUMVA|nr:Sorbitol dehydrogenase [Eumeta japonica]
MSQNMINRKGCSILILSVGGSAADETVYFRACASQNGACTVLFRVPRNVELELSAASAARTRRLLQDQSNDDHVIFCTVDVIEKDVPEQFATTVMIEIFCVRAQLPGGRRRASGGVSILSINVIDRSEREENRIFSVDRIGDTGAGEGLARKCNVDRMRTVDGSGLGHEVFAGRSSAYDRPRNWSDRHIVHSTSVTHRHTHAQTHTHTQYTGFYKYVNVLVVRVVINSSIYAYRREICAAHARPVATRRRRAPYARRRGGSVKVGSKVKNLSVGDRVAVEPGVPCRRCDFCRTGRYHLCPDIAFCATPPVHGNLVRYYKHAADFCYKLPDHVTMEEGALLEPLSVGVHACRRGGVGAGCSVLVLGAGPVGLLTMLAARAMGATDILITDIVQSRLDFARSLGANHTLLVSAQSDEAELVMRVHELLGGHPEVSIDCSGAEATVRLGLLATKSGGVVVLVGMGKPELTVPLAGTVAREVDIRGIFRYVNE